MASITWNPSTYMPRLMSDFSISANGSFSFLVNAWMRMLSRCRRVDGARDANSPLSLYCPTGHFKDPI